MRTLNDRAIAIAAVRDTDHATDLKTELISEEIAGHGAAKSVFDVAWKLERLVGETGFAVVEVVVEIEDAELLGRCEMERLQTARSLGRYEGVHRCA